MAVIEALGVLLVVVGAHGCHGCTEEDKPSWILHTAYPHEASPDRSGIFYSLDMDSTNVPWKAGDAYCKEMYGASASLYQPHDRTEMDFIQRLWLKQPLADMEVMSLNIWTGLTKFEGEWEWLKNNRGLIPEVWKDSGIGACAAWNVIDNTWFDSNCDALHSVLCKTVNHYREVYHAPDIDAMAAFVVDNKNHTQAISDCGNDGYQMYTINTPEANVFLTGLYNRMKRATLFPLPYLYWVNADDPVNGQCIAWDAKRGGVSAVICDQELSYTCSYRHNPKQNSVSMTATRPKTQRETTSKTHAPVGHKVRKRSIADQPKTDLETSGDPMEAPGSATIGLVTIAIISTIGIILLISDIPTIYLSLKSAIGNMANFCGCTRDYVSTDTVDSSKEGRPVRDL